VFAGCAAWGMAASSQPHSLDCAVHVGRRVSGGFVLFNCCFMCNLSTCLFRTGLDFPQTANSKSLRIAYFSAFSKFRPPSFTSRAPERLDLFNKLSQCGKTPREKNPIMGIDIEVHDWMADDVEDDASIWEMARCAITALEKVQARVPMLVVRSAMRLHSSSESVWATSVRTGDC